MLTYVYESIFSSPADVLVNTVNTVGVMGKGLALEFKTLYPEMFSEYQAKCESGELKIGSLMIFRTSNKTVLNFPTKKHWRSPSRVEYIEAGLQRFIDSFRELGITSVSFPQLGCGNGELDWESQVGPLMERYLAPLKIDVFIHLYPESGVAEHRITREMKRWLREEPQSLSVYEVWDDLFGEPFPTEEDGDDAIAETSILAATLRIVWARLRAYGFVSRKEATEGFGETGAHLFESLARLPYIEMTSFHQRKAGGFSDVTEMRGSTISGWEPGIRVAPERMAQKEVQLGMFDQDWR